MPAVSGQNAPLRPKTCGRLAGPKGPGTRVPSGSHISSGKRAFSLITTKCLANELIGYHSADWPGNGQSNEVQVDQRPSGGLELPPVAPVLMQSLRAVGYTTPAAVADLVDNSISANARRVAIRFTAAPEPLVAVVDDGDGMDESTLVSAMRFGSRDPRLPSTGIDLGRFGLGLKTASLSQCRRVTVASCSHGRLAVARWDLDECERRGSWWLEIPESSTVPPDVIGLLRSNGRGTAVVWQNLDRLAIDGISDPRHALDVSMESVGDHLAMVFHRFLAGEVGGAFDITINDRPLPRLDPFLEGHARGQSLHGESFMVDGHAVTVSPFVLPFPSRLKPGELDRAGGRESLKTGHGFYVYRGGRLVVPGGWFRIVPSDELIRLARVRVDVPVELDHLWKVDIRKTMAEPPAALRPELKRIVGAVTIRSRRVYSYKGTQQQNADRIPVWVRQDSRDGAASWKVNREHPAIAAMMKPGRSDLDLQQVLRLVEELLPVHDIHLHISNDLPVVETHTIENADLQALARRMVDVFADQPEVVKLLLDRLPLTDPFSRDPDYARQIADALRT